MPVPRRGSRAGKTLGFFYKKMVFRFFKGFLGGFNLKMPDTKLLPTSKDSAM